jgi:hypothetical protein
MTEDSGQDLIEYALVAALGLGIDAAANNLSHSIGITLNGVGTFALERGSWKLIKHLAVIGFGDLSNQDWIVPSGILKCATLRAVRAVCVCVKYWQVPLPSLPISPKIGARSCRFDAYTSTACDLRPWRCKLAESVNFLPP